MGEEKHLPEIFSGGMKLCSVQLDVRIEAAEKSSEIGRIRGELKN